VTARGRRGARGDLPRGWAHAAWPLLAPGIDRDKQASRPSQEDGEAVWAITEEGGGLAGSPFSPSMAQGHTKREGCDISSPAVAQELRNGAIRRSDLFPTAFCRFSRGVLTPRALEALCTAARLARQLSRDGRCALSPLFLLSPGCRDSSRAKPHKYGCSPAAGCRSSAAPRQAEGKAGRSSGWPYIYCLSQKAG